MTGVAQDGADSLQATKKVAEGCSEWALILVEVRRWVVRWVRCRAGRNLAACVWCQFGQLSSLAPENFELVRPCVRICEVAHSVSAWRACAATEPMEHTSRGVPVVTSSVRRATQNSS